MLYKFFCFMFFVLFTLAIPFIYCGHTHDEWPANEDLGGSVYAGAHGHVLVAAQGNDTDFHVHCIGFAHWDRAGNYTVFSTVSETNGGNWGRENYQDDDSAQDTFKTGCREVTKVAFKVPRLLDPTKVKWSGSATVQDTTTGVTKRAFAPKNDMWRFGHGGQEDEDGSDEDIDDADNNQGANNNLGITLANSDQTPQPGDSVTLNLVTADPFYDVSWYVHTPWDTSSSGTYQGYTYGGGTATTASLTYTFPSGAMHTGDFMFRAVIYDPDMSSYTETYTVSVSSE